MYELLRVLVAPLDASAGRMRVEICALMHKCTCLLVERETRICACVRVCVLMYVICRQANTNHLLSDAAAVCSSADEQRCPSCLSALS
jgi:hypothetical protein